MRSALGLWGCVGSAMAEVCGEGVCVRVGVGVCAGLCLKGRGANEAVPERLQSGHRGCDSGWGGGYWRLEMRLGLVLG